MSPFRENPISLRLFSHREDAISLHRTEITPRESFLFPELRAPTLLCKTIARGGKWLETITETLRICCAKNPMETKATATYPLSVFCVNKYIHKYIQTKTHYFFQGKITRQQQRFRENNVTPAAWLRHSYVLVCHQINQCLGSDLQHLSHARGTCRI